MRLIFRIVVRGRVQGVGFRYWVMRQAIAHRIDGWVRNCADGSVEAVLAGEEEHVHALIAECRSGSAAAAVTDVTKTPVAEDPGSGFRIVA